MEFVRETSDARQERRNEWRGNHQPSLAREQITADVPIEPEYIKPSIFDMFFGFAYMLGAYGR